LAKGEPRQEGQRPILVDATGYKAGRLASYVAKLLLLGHHVSVINAERAVVTGRKSSIMKRLLMLRGRKQFRSHKVISVWYPTRADALLRHTIMRMLPRDKPRGREAARRLRVFSGPREVAGSEHRDFSDAKLVKPISRSERLVRYVTLEELSRSLRGQG